MNERRPVVYVAHRMTNRYCDELVQEALLTTRVLENYGFEVLDPIILEDVPNRHELLEQTDEDRLKKHWQRDKECLQMCHMVLDYHSCNKSDGVGVELGLARFAYWKPCFRIYPDVGFCISRLEYDNVFESLSEAILMMAAKYGTCNQLLKWRLKMLAKSLPHFVWLQIKFLGDLL